MKNIKLFLFMMASTVSLTARYHQVSSDKSFEDLINKYPYAVVCFAHSGPEEGEKMDQEEKRELRKNFRDLRRRVKDAADSGDYKKYLRKDVGFLVIDSSSGRAQEIDDAFELNQFPTCMVFKNGKAHSYMSKHAQIFNPISKSSIINLLEKNFEDELYDLVGERKEEEKQEREERLARYAASARYGWGPYGYWGYSYPYYGWGFAGPRYGWGHGYGYWC